MSVYRHVRSFVVHLPRLILRPLMPKYEFAEMLRTAQIPCVGYIAKNGRVVIYGKTGNYSWLDATGRI